MGTWGTAIYSCDIANDVRDTCKEIFAFYDIQKGNDILFSVFKDVIEQSYVDNEYASFWYALADWQWKHGMLTDSIKNKALELLDDYAGLDEWINEGNYKDAEKRKKVLDTLKEQLLSPLPPYKKPKASTARPKHKPGDIIIFKASADPRWTCWKITSLRWPAFFESQIFSNSEYENVKGYDAQGKYLALLCIGSVKEPYSQYVEDVFDERSLYVWYDYLSAEKPTQDILKECGFLPFISWGFKDYNRGTTESVNWEYTFTLACERFRTGTDFGIDEISKLQNVSEVERFNVLFSKKKYSSDYSGGFCLYSVFDMVFQEKNRAELLNEKIDNLLDTETLNPILAPPSKVDEQIQKLRESRK